MTCFHSRYQVNGENLKNVSIVKTNVAIKVQLILHNMLIETTKENQYILASDETMSSIIKLSSEFKL